MSTAISWQQKYRRNYTAILATPVGEVKLPHYSVSQSCTLCRRVCTHIDSRRNNLRCRPWAIEPSVHLGIDLQVCSSVVTIVYTVDFLLLL